MRILRLDLHSYPYKIQVVQKPEECDAAKRLVFSQQMVELINRNKEVLMSDEAYFHLTGLMNKQNCRCWSDQHPRELVQKPMHSSKVKVWCCGSFRHYRSLLWGRTWKFLHCDLWALRNDLGLHSSSPRSSSEKNHFQQDGVTSHTAKIAMNISRPLFPGHLISRHGDIAKPARSSDLSMWFLPVGPP